MTDSLTTLISKVQAQLLDDGTRFTTATCTAALRAALKDYNFAAPVHAGTLITVVAEQKEYELSDEADAETAIEILDILEQDCLSPFVQDPAHNGADFTRLVNLGLDSGQLPMAFQGGKKVSEIRIAHGTSSFFPLATLANLG